MTHEFTVVEYKTTCGFTAVVLEVGPDDTLFGREQRWQDGPWDARRWAVNGKSKTNQTGKKSDLVAPTRTIWMVSWVSRNGTVKADWTNFERVAYLLGMGNGRTLIAVTGPHEVPA